MQNTNVFRFVATIPLVALSAGCVLGPNDGDRWPASDHSLTQEVAVWVTDGMKQQDFRVECFVPPSWWNTNPHWADFSLLTASGVTQNHGGELWHEFVVHPLVNDQLFPWCWENNPGGTQGNKLLRARVRIVNEADWALFHYGPGYLSCSAQFGYDPYDTINNCSVGGEIWVYADSW